MNVSFLDKERKMNTKRVTSLFFMLFLFLGVSCGKNEKNRTYGGSTYANPTFPGVIDGIPFGQKFANLIANPSMRCMSNAARVTIGFKFQSNGFGPGQVMNIGVNGDLNNLAGVKTLYVGSTPEHDIVVVKDYGMTKDVIISLCDLDRWGPAISNVQLFGDFYGSPVTSCSVNQISEFNIGLMYPQSVEPIFLQIAPINGSYPIDGVCPFDFYSDQI